MKTLNHTTRSYLSLPLSLYFFYTTAVNADPLAQNSLDKSHTETSVLPQTISTQSNDDNTPYKMKQWIDSYQQSMTDSVHTVGEYIDQSLTKDENEAELTNRSYLRIRQRSIYSYRGKLENDFKVYFKLDLPHVKRDWKLILDSEPSDYDSLESKQRGIASGSKTQSGDTVGGFRLQDTQFGNWSSDFDIGIKLKFPLDPFVKTRLTRVDNVSENWTTQLEQELFYYHSKGFGSLSQLSGFYALTPDHKNIFRTTTSAQYLQEDDKWELVQQFNVYQRATERDLFEYSMGISADTDEMKEITNYWVSAEWKRRIYKHWLYLAARPQLEFPRDYNYHANLGVMIELEMFFSKNRKIDELKRYIPKPVKLRNET
ncbi:hypothetical protein [uncultured Photobacterium sp.]|uniref:hypothetical protein n=1 Tax=uncultured Photobacterium sp. TaxID=173973 RepID=UPI00260DC168|nr:hypothetical protein [uncultured Photobacterium sp.]